MAFREVQFPACLSFGAMGGPAFSTEIVTVMSGHERRNANWSEMRHSWDVAQAVQTEDDHKLIRAFFLSVGGRKDGFRFRDPFDHVVAAGEGVVDGLTSMTFQLQKRYVSDDVTTLRDIVKPVAAGFALFDGVTPLVLTTDYTLSTVTGIVTTTAPRTAGNLTWGGEFDTPARFDVDQLRGTIQSKNASGLLIAWDSIPIVELRLP